jgi:hypothetical protein
MTTPTAAETIGSIALTLFDKTDLEMTYGKLHPLGTLLATDGLTVKKGMKLGQIQKVSNEMGNVEYLKVPVSLSTITAGSYTRGNASAFSFGMRTNRVYAYVAPVHYQAPATVASTDIDTRAAYTGSDDMKVKYLSDELMEAKSALFAKVSADALHSSTQSNGVEAVGVTFAATGTSSGISATTHTEWAANVINMDLLTSDRLTLSKLAYEIRKHRVTNGGDIKVIGCGWGVHDLLTKEWEAKGLQMVDIVKFFGSSAGSHDPNLRMETSMSCMMVEGAIIVPDDDFNDNNSTTVIGYDPADWWIKCSTKNNFRVKGWEDAWSVGADEQRAVVLWSGCTGTWNRRKLLEFTGCATS